MEVGDALVGVDHGQIGTVGVSLRDSGFDLASGVGIELVEGGDHVAPAVVRVGTGGGQCFTELLEHVGEERLDPVAEDDRIRDLHHRRLEVK